MKPLSFTFASIDRNSIGFSYICDEQMIKYSIADMFGNIHLRGNLTQQELYTIAIDTLEAGRYQLVIMDGGKLVKREFAKPR